MNDVYRALVALHVLGGGLGLLVLAVPLIVRKGGKLHRRVGWVFSVAMVLAAFTGTIIAGVLMFAPVIARPHATTEALEAIRASGPFFAVLSVMLFESVWVGHRSLVRRRNPDARPIDGVPSAVLLLSGVALGILGVTTSNPLSAIFGGFAVLGGFGNLQFSLRPLATPKSWWYMHMQSMIGASIAALTAFLVQNVARFADVPQDWMWVPWVAPGVVGGIGTTIWVQYYRRRFNESRTARSDAGATVA